MYQPITFEEHLAAKLKRFQCESKGDGNGICYWLRCRKAERFCGMFTPAAQIQWLPGCPFQVMHEEHVELRKEEPTEDGAPETGP